MFDGDKSQLDRKTFVQCILGPKTYPSDISGIYLIKF